VLDSLLTIVHFSQLDDCAQPKVAVSGNPDVAVAVTKRCLRLYHCWSCCLRTQAAAAAAAATGTTLKCSGLSEADKKNGKFANCVDSEASAAAVLKKVGGGAAMAPTFIKADGKDIKSKDVACAGKAFCEVGR
jgi:hypothetical protein